MAKKQGNRRVFRLNIMWLWSAVLLLIIGFWLFGSSPEKPVRSDWATVDELVRAGDVEKIEIVNRDIAQVYLKELYI